MFVYLFAMATMMLTQLWRQSSSTTNAFNTIVPSPSVSRQLTTGTCMNHRYSLLSSVPPTAQNTKRVMDPARLFHNNIARKYFMSQQENQDDTPSSTTSTTTSTTTTKSATTEIFDTTTPSNINSLMDMSPTEFILATENMDPTTRAVVEAAKKKQQQQQQDGDGNIENNNNYPIDLPSPVLLATSMILAIISTGSLFQLFGITSNPNPIADVSSSVATSSSSSSSSSLELGFIPTAIIVLIGTPLSIYMLYAAITKATAETEADDEAFLSGK